MILIFNTKINYKLGLSLLWNLFIDIPIRSIRNSNPKNQL
jgi:hypothetical protein